MIGEPIIFDGHSRKTKWPDNNVKLFRDSKGLTRAQLAKMVELQESIISYIEQGEIKPLVRTMRKIADALDAEMEALFPEKWKRLKKTAKQVLVLEDDPIRIEQFKVALEGQEVIFVDTAMRAIDELKIGQYDIAFLDHDLGGEMYCPSDEKTGYAVAVWLSEHVDRIPMMVYLHSMNPTGRANMKLALPDAVEMPFSVIADEVSYIMKSKRNRG